MSSQLESRNMPGQAPESQCTKALKLCSWSRSRISSSSYETFFAKQDTSPHQMRNHSHQTPTISTTRIQPQLPQLDNHAQIRITKAQIRHTHTEQRRVTNSHKHFNLRCDKIP
ncbi:hypothetical protein Droror1_Dr00026655 [Drosera rotundifolia]